MDVVSHRSAAQLHHLGDLDADRLEFTTAVRRQTRSADVRFHRAALTRRDWSLIEGLPVTTVLRTITDLARARLDGGHLAGAVRDAVTTLHVDPALIATALAPYGHHYGAAAGDGNALLTRFLHDAGLPQATLTAARLVRSQQPEARARTTTARTD